MIPDLRAERRNRGLLLRDVAADLGITISFLSLVERRQRRPSPPVAKRIADLYGYDEITDVWPDFNEKAAA